MKNNFNDLRSRIKVPSVHTIVGNTDVLPRKRKRRQSASSTKEKRLAVSVRGKTQQVKVQKRPFTKYCELCLSKTIILSYHHWDDNNLCKGLWLCNACHRFAEYIDLHLKMINRYTMLKRRADADVLSFAFRPVSVANTDTPLIDTLLSYVLAGSKDKENRTDPKEVAL